MRAAVSSLLCLWLLAPLAAGAEIRTILSAHRDPEQVAIRGPRGMTIDPAGNLYVAAQMSSNLVKIAPDGTITELLGPEGDGQGHKLGRPRNVVRDKKGNLYVTGEWSMNALGRDHAADRRHR